MTKMMIVMMVEMMTVMTAVMSDGGDEIGSMFPFIKYFIAYVYYLC